MTLSKRAWQKVTRLPRAGGLTLGRYVAEKMVQDPKHVGFTLARYKFAAKMLRSCGRVIEVGCGEGLGGLMILAETNARFVGVDVDPDQIAYAERHVAPWGKGRIEFRCQDLVASPLRGPAADGLLSLDVIEHIDPSEEDRFLRHAFAPLATDAVAVIGTPSKLAERYAGEASRAGHVNLFDPERLTLTLERYFARVFLFSMNDEMVHTGFSKMAHYLMALCVGPRRRRRANGLAKRRQPIS